MNVPVPNPEGLSLSGFTEFLYTAFFASRFPPGMPGRVPALEPLAFENASPGVRLAWRAAAEQALKLAPLVKTDSAGNAMYQRAQ
jgi:hypothetical protein